MRHLRIKKGTDVIHQDGPGQSGPGLSKYSQIELFVTLSTSGLSGVHGCDGNSNKLGLMY